MRSVELADREPGTAQRRLAALPAAEVTFHRPLLRPEAIVLPASPHEPILAIRDAIRDAFTETRLGDAPEARDGFLPHVSLAYINQDGPAEPITTALAEVTAAPAVVAMSRASLIVLDRDTHMYHWRERAHARTAQPNPRTSNRGL